MIINDEDDFMYLEMSFEQFVRFVRRHTVDWQKHLTAYLSDSNVYEDEKSESLEMVGLHPGNVRQKMLVNYFEGKVPLSDTIGHLYEEEILSRDFNEPLLRSYFKRGNRRLENLLFFMLEKNPTDIDLLYDVTLLNFYRPILKKLVKVYLRACCLADDLYHFKRLVNNFQLSVENYGFDSFAALREHGISTTDKLTLLDALEEGYKESKLQLEILEKACDEEVIH